MLYDKYTEKMLVSCKKWIPGYVVGLASIGFKGFNDLMQANH